MNEPMKSLGDYYNRIIDRGVEPAMLFQLLEIFLEEIDEKKSMFKEFRVEKEKKKQAQIINLVVARMNTQVVHEHLVEPAYLPHKKGGFAYNQTVEVLELFRDCTFYHLQQSADATMEGYDKHLRESLVTYTPYGESVYELPNLSQILQMSLNEPCRETALENYLGSSLRKYNIALEYIVRASLECLGRSSRLGEKRKQIIEYLYIEPLQDFVADESPWIRFDMKRSAYYYNHQKAIEYLSMKFFGPYGERLQREEIL